MTTDDWIVDELLGAGWEHEAATVYAISVDSDADPDHELMVGVRNASGLGSLRYAGADDEWWSTTGVPVLAGPVPA